ncbi:MAG: hypothetical protein JOY80_08260 [Candidatus Dormibacteraeota bacterium]|nr:hypothetical protein [Candidatus Dormibacteraeota bacterium]
MSRRSLRALLLAPILGAACFAMPLVALAGSGYTTADGNGQGHNIDHVGGGTGISPGDVISVGMVFQEKGAHNAATLYALNTVASIAYSCSSQGGSATIGTQNIPIPSGPYDIPANYNANGGWYPSNQWSYNQTYDAVATVPDWCNGGPLYVTNNGETYSGSLGSPDNTSNQFQVQLHTAIPATQPNTGNINCGNPSQNPTQNNGQGQQGCNFNQNGSADNVTAEQYSPPSSPQNNGGQPTGGPTSGNGPPSTPSGTTPAGGIAPARVSGGAGTGSSGGSAAPGLGIPPGSGSPTPAASPVPPAVGSPSGLGSAAQLITAVTAGWVPLALLIALLAIVITAVLIAGRRRRRTPESTGNPAAG